MKYIPLLLLSLLLLCSQKAYSQCDFERYMERSLGKLDDGFTFLKSFKLEVPPGQFVPHTIVCTKGTVYMLKITDADHDHAHVSIVARLFSPGGKEVATSLDTKSKHRYDGFTFVCKETGIYHLEFVYTYSKKKCGGAVLGFRKPKS